MRTRRARSYGDRNTTTNQEKLLPMTATTFMICIAGLAISVGMLAATRMALLSFLCGARGESARRRLDEV
jgi:hypothetical protein